jgi:hypothetical protein
MKCILILWSGWGAVRKHQWWSGAGHMTDSHICLGYLLERCREKEFKFIKSGKRKRPLLDLAMWNKFSHFIKGRATTDISVKGYNCFARKLTAEPNPSFWSTLNAIQHCSKLTPSCLIPNVKTLKCILILWSDWGAIWKHQRWSWAGNIWLVRILWESTCCLF